MRSQDINDQIRIALNQLYPFQGTFTYWYNFFYDSLHRQRVQNWNSYNLLQIQIDVDFLYCR